MVPGVIAFGSCEFTGKEGHRDKLGFFSKPLGKYSFDSCLGGIHLYSEGSFWVRKVENGCSSDAYLSCVKARSALSFHQSFFGFFGRSGVSGAVLRLKLQMKCL